MGLGEAFPDHLDLVFLVGLQGQNGKEVAGGGVQGTERDSFVQALNGSLSTFLGGGVFFVCVEETESSKSRTIVRIGFCCAEESGASFFF